jgi:hypothetical protein
LLARFGAGPARAEAGPSVPGGNVAGARGRALGGAFVAAPSDAFGVFFNPAALGGLESGGVGLTHRTLDAIWTQESGVLGLRPWASRPLLLGVAVHVQRRSGTPSDDALDGFQGLPGDHGYRGTLQAAWRASESWCLGAGVGRLSTPRLDTERRRGWSANAGVTWVRGPTRLGLALQDAGFGLRDAAGTVEATWRGAVGLWQALWRERVGLALQVDGDAAELWRGSGGLEYWAHRSVALRAGVEKAFESGHVARWGAGLGLRRERLQLDYAWQGGAQARAEHEIALQFAFGGAPRELTAATPPAAPQAVQPRSAAAPPPPPAAATKPAPAPQAAVPAPAPAPRPPVEDPAPAAPAAPPLPAPSQEPPAAAPAAARYVVRAGVHDNLDSAAQEIARLYRIELRPKLERRGKLFVVVVQRCATRREALEWQERASKAGVRCSVDEE